MKPFFYTVVTDLEAYNLPRRVNECQGDPEALKRVADTISSKLIALYEQMKKEEVKK